MLIENEYFDFTLSKIDYFILHLMHDSFINVLKLYSNIPIQLPALLILVFPSLCFWFSVKNVVHFYLEIVS